MNQPRPDALEEAIEAFQRMRVPDRPPDAEVLARLGHYRGDKQRPPSSSVSKRSYVMRLLLSSAAALILVFAVGLFAVVLHSVPAVAVADVVHAAKQHKVVRYKQQQTTDAGASSGARLESTVYADLLAGRLRIESQFEGPDGEAIQISIFDPVRTLETDSRQRTARLCRTSKDYKSFCCSLEEFERHKGVTQMKDKLGGVATVRYRFEEGNEVSTLWIDAKTKLPVRMEQELIDPTPEITLKRLVWTDFAWEPDLPKSFKSLDELFSTRPPEGYAVENYAQEKARRGQGNNER